VSDEALLARVPYFRALAPADRRGLARRCRPAVFDRGAAIFTEGEPCEALWVVAEGRVKIFRLSPRGREQVLHTEGPGATLGEVPLFDGRGYVASAAALGRARLLRLPRPEVTALCRRHPDVALSIIATMAARVRAFASLAGDLALRPVSERVGQLILDEARRSGRRTAGGVEVRLPGTQEQIAARIGSVREPVSRALARLARRGLLVSRGRGVLVVDVDRLRAALEQE
jgi:CRP/FNR family transcriptional regulator